MDTAKKVAVTMARPRRPRRILRRIVRDLVLLYVVVCLLFYLLQAKMIFPGAATQGSAETVVDPPPGTQLLTLHAADGTKIAGLFGKALAPGSETTAQLPTVLYFYGNGMCLKDAVGEFQQFRRLGANVLAIEYEGYGMSGGTASEAGCYAAAEAGYSCLLGRPDIDHRKIIPAGWSLGAAVAIDLARRHAGEGHIRGVMAFSAFTSLGEVGRFHYPFLPVTTLLKHHFLSAEKVGGIGVPLLLGHGGKDNLVPHAMMERLAQAAMRGGVPVTQFTVANAGHNDFFSEGEEQISREVSAFFQKMVKAE